MSLWDSIYIAGTGVDLPPSVPVSEAVADGRYPAKLAEITQQRAVTVAEKEQPPVEFAVNAARQAIEQAGHSFDEVGLIAHAVVLDAGPRVWNSASYIERELGPGGYRDIAQVTNGCDGALTALRWAAAHLTAQSTHPAALVTSADCWQEPLINRWVADPDAPLADGGTAMVLSRQQGFARLLATASHTEPRLEAMHRGDTLCGHLVRTPVSIRERALSFFASMPKEEMWQLHAESMQAAAARVLDDAGITNDQVTCMLMAVHGQYMLEREYFPYLKFNVAQSSRERGRDIGHLGAGDPIALLHFLMEAGELRSGDIALMFGEGVGMVHSAALIQII